MLNRVKKFTAGVLGGLAVVMFTALVLDVLWGVLTRYVFGQQASWSEELARFLLVWLAMLGAALAYLEQRHLGMDILTRSLDDSARRFAQVVSHILVFLFAVAVMVYGGGALFLERWDSGQIMPALPIRKAWFYLSVPVCGALIAIFALEAVWECRPGGNKINSPAEEAKSP